MTAKSMTTYGNSRRSGGAGYFIKSGRTALLGSAAAILVLSHAGAALAQESDEEEPGLKLEEVIVTATKSSRNVQDVPLSITALSAEALSVRGIANSDDLQRIVPGLVVTNTGNNAGSGFGSNMAIRGVSTPNSTPGGDPGVPVYIDGHYIQASSFALRDMLDIQRVEALRGPQGVLKGRNASGGSIELITARPSDEFGGNVSVDIGSYDRRETRLVLSGPLTDKLRVRAAISDEVSDGYIENISPVAPRKDLMYDDSTSLRLSAEYDVADNLELFVSGYWYEDTGSSTVYTVTGEFDRTSPYYVTLPADYVNPTELDPYKSRADSPHEDYDFGQGVSLDLTWDVGGITVKSLNAYNESRSELILDLDMTDAVPTVEWGNFVDYETVSSELQFISDNSSALKWVGGVFYYSEKSTTETFFDADPAIFAARFTEINDPLPTLESKALGVFANIDYDVTDKLELVLGGRYSYDDKSMIRGLTRTYGGTVLTDTSGVTDLQKDWKKFTYRAGLNYHVSDDVMLFGSYSQGYRAGGFNAFAFQELSYEPESIDALEVGIKSHWLDDRIELNVSAFSNDYTDKQETVSKVIRDENGEEVDFVTSIQNSSTATVRGVELEFLALVSENLSVDAVVGYLDATYGELTAVDGDRPQLGEFDLAGNTLPLASDWKYNLGIQYKIPLRDDLGSLSFRGDYSYVSEYFTSYFNRSLATTAPYADNVPAHDNINARLIWADPDATWQADLYVQNLADSADLTHQNPTYHNAGLNFVVYTRPRTFGARLTHRF
tara:strand:+ start:616 stop:2955 length:2340 start_codon:yes stop_codon:yes gene_type:complete